MWSAIEMNQACRFVVWGRVQGVGYRDFAQRAANDLRLAGYARNLDDGTVEVYAIGSSQQIDELEQKLRVGPRAADVRAVERSEAEMLHYEGFSIRY